MTDIKELALKVAKDIGYWDEQEEYILDFATRLIAAYTEGQEPISLYPCGFKELHSLVIKHGAFLAQGMNEDEPVTESIRSAAMVLVGYAKDMSGLLARQPLYTAPPEPAPQQQKPQTTIGDSANPAQPAAARAATSSEEVREMVERLRRDTGSRIVAESRCHEAANLIERLAARVDELKQANDGLATAEAKLRRCLENYRGQVNQYGQETASTALAIPAIPDERIATLEQQVAALIEERNQEHSMACEIHAANLEIRYELAAAQAQLEEARAEIERLKREN